ncbi:MULTISPECIES: hypothetical protein [Bradyrhizobium]|uniref:hypothetical protein n=1 Tax=Bradyrhizobium TaxID=374 RepID=UPI00115FA59F|nr:MULTISPECIES: hypothetical protein [Bradyrhizobium]
MLAFLNVKFPDANVWTWAAILFFGPLVCAAAYGLIWHELLKPLFLRARTTELAPATTRPKYKVSMWLIFKIWAGWYVSKAALIGLLYWADVPLSNRIYNIVMVGALFVTFGIWGIWVGLLKPTLQDGTAAKTTEPATRKSLAALQAPSSYKAPKWVVEGLIIAAIWAVFEAALLLWAYWYGAPPTAPIFNLAPVIAFVMALIVRRTIWTALVNLLFFPAPPRASRKPFSDKVEEFWADSPRR